MNFARAVQILCDADVDFVVIGGWSAILHGSVYVTLDIDFSYSRRSENLRKLVNALAPFEPRPRGFPAELPFIWDEASLRSSTVLTLTTTLGDIDLLSEVDGIGAYEVVKGESVLTEAFERKFLILDLPGLIRSKKSVNRPKDRNMLSELEALLEARQSE